MKKKYKFLISGILFVPLLAYIDTIIFQERNFISYIGICLFEWLIFFFGVIVGEQWFKDT